MSWSFYFLIHYVLLPLLWIICISDNTTEKNYIMLEARLSALFKKEEEYTILEKWVFFLKWNLYFSFLLFMISWILLLLLNFSNRFAGKTLEGLHYEPLFNYFEKVSWTLKHLLKVSILLFLVFLNCLYFLYIIPL